LSFILAGCGFIGRNLVQYLIENDLVSAVRVVDKVPPQTAWLNNRHQQLFSIPKVQFKSANLINPGMCYVTVIRISISIDKYKVEAKLYRYLFPFTGK
jgi:nucleoside-diphosphate-sugar epimerase